MQQEHFWGLPLMAATLAGLVVAVVGLAYALKTRRRRLAGGIVAASLVWLGVYAAVLAGTSLGSRERVLGLNQRIAFCGFYLDCHLGVEVIGVSKTKALGSGENQQTALGTYYVVTVKVSSDAKAAALYFDEPLVSVVDAQGRAYYRSAAGELALESVQGRAVPFAQALAPRGGFFLKALVFDLPEDAGSLSLLVSEGDWFERLFELFLIGDEDSLFHAKTLIRLEL